MNPFGIGTIFGDIKRKILMKNEDYENFAWLIMALDNYRTGKRVKDSILREKTRLVRNKFKIPSINIIRDDIEAIKSVADKREPRMKFYANLMITLQFLIKQGLAIFLLLSFITVITFKSFLTTQQMQWILYIIIFGAVVVVWLRWYIRDKIMRIYAKYQNEYRKNQLNIRDYIQELIDVMREDLKETGDNPKKYKMALYYKDYKHIKILKHPNWWRYYYASAIDTS
ncbi:MAG TPA: hypothetical protein ENG41_04660 [Methanomicrobia archaeon]|nr:MAG: hypothetical protein DRN45_02295 [Thermococci archaeon]RLG02149.1 MAG: hypothetical protein DRN58_00080 [Thermococci archaeon]HDN81993.1 hypothetical protein [Methanomicrobia archaeon]HEC95922.1 hypothetical protein [Euryarchaeota archaeon]HHF09664.1 hypothetical protein [Methanomicrobia archaeon]